MSNKIQTNPPGENEKDPSNLEECFCLKQLKAIQDGHVTIPRGKDIHIFIWKCEHIPTEYVIISKRNEGTKIYKLIDI